MTVTFWVIEEAVGNGFYITWPGIYERRETAQVVIDRAGADAEPKLYQASEEYTGGPVRCEVSNAEAEVTK